jgi:hypothetical protein
MGLSVANWNWNLCYLEKYPKTGFAVLFIWRTRTEIYTFENKTD